MYYGRVVPGGSILVELRMGKVLFGRDVNVTSYSYEYWLTQDESAPRKVSPLSNFELIVKKVQNPEKLKNSSFILKNNYITTFMHVSHYIPIYFYPLNIMLVLMKLNNT